MIAVAGGKGGSGKTTTVVGLARALARRGTAVVAADADWDLPNLARLAAETADDARAASDRATGPDDPPSVVDAVRERTSVRPDRAAPTVLAAPADPLSVDAASVLADLGNATPDDVPVVLDCPAGAAPDAAAPLRAADRSLVVTRLRRAALRDAAKTAALARRLGCPPVGAVAVGRASAPDGVAALLGCPVLGDVPDGGPEPLSDAAVRAAYDDLARRIARTEAASAWRVP